jgi:hypothetical protein
LLTSTKNVVICVIPWKALAPILVTDDEIVIDVTPEASWKALAPILLYVTIRTLVAPYNNAVAPVNDPLPLNTFVSHDTVTPALPNNVILEPGVMLRTSKSVDSSNMALVMPDLKNALEPMLVTDDGMLMDVIAIASWKALVPMLVTDDGIIYDVRLLPTEYWIRTVLSLLNNAP